MTFARGDKVTWYHTQPGGYAFIDPVAALVEGTTPQRVKIRIAIRLSGQWIHVFRIVKPEKLRPRSIDVPVLDG